MAINVSVQYNGGLLPDIILMRGNPFKCHEEVLYLQPMIPPKRFDIFSLTVGDARKVEACSDFSLNTKHMPEKKIGEGHSIERVWYSASREPSDNLPGSQPCTQTHSIYNSVLSGFQVSLVRPTERSQGAQNTDAKSRGIPRLLSRVYSRPCCTAASCGARARATKTRCAEPTTGS